MLIKVSDDSVLEFDFVSDFIEYDNGIRFYKSSDYSSCNHFHEAKNITIDEFLKLYLEAKKNNELFLDLTMPKSKPVSLEVGKTYITRGGNDVTITRCDNSYPFAGTLGVTIRYYTPKGEYFVGSESDFDIMGEKSA